MGLFVFTRKQDRSNDNAGYKHRDEGQASEAWRSWINSPELLVQESLVADDLFVSTRYAITASEFAGTSLKTSERGNPHYFDDSRGQGGKGNMDQRRFPGTAFLERPKEIAGARSHAVECSRRDRQARQRGNPSPAIRLFVRDRVRAPATSGLVHLDQSRICKDTLGP